MAREPNILWKSGGVPLAIGQLKWSAKSYPAICKMLSFELPYPMLGNTFKKVI
jgi:hypothetical protein